MSDNACYLYVEKLTWSLLELTPDSNSPSLLWWFVFNSGYDWFTFSHQAGKSFLLLSLVTWEQGLTTWVWWVLFSAFLAIWSVGELLSDVDEPVGRVLRSKPTVKPIEYSLLWDGTGAFSHSFLNENLTRLAGGKSAAWEGVLRQQRGRSCTGKRGSQMSRQMSRIPTPPYAPALGM